MSEWNKDGTVLTYFVKPAIPIDFLLREEIKGEMLKLYSGFKITEPTNEEERRTIQLRDVDGNYIQFFEPSDLKYIGKNKTEDFGYGNQIQTLSITAKKSKEILNKFIKDIYKLRGTTKYKTTFFKCTQKCKIKNSINLSDILPPEIKRELPRILGYDSNFIHLNELSIAIVGKREDKIAGHSMIKISHENPEEYEEKELSINIESYREEDLFSKTKDIIKLSESYIKKGKK